MVIHIIRQPINAYPSLGNAVDGSLSTNKFSFIFSGDKLATYQISIFDSVTNATVYTGSSTALVLYNGQTFEASIPASSFTNGTDLIWRARLSQTDSTMRVISSTVQNGSTTSIINVRPNSGIKAGMTLNIGAETKTISNFVNYLSISNSTLASGSTYDVINIATGLTPSNVVQYTLAIGNQKRTVISYDATTGYAIVAPAFPSLYPAGTAYKIIDENVAVATVSVAFGSVPAIGTAYTVFTSFIDTPNYFFKARTLPTLSVTHANLTSRKNTFVGTYAQAQGTAVKYHIFNLYDETGVLLHTTGQVFSGFLEYQYDAFVSGLSYGIELIVMNQDDVSTTTGIEEFSVLYGTPDLNAKPILTNLEDSNAVQVDWVKDKQSIGVASGTVSYETDFPFTGTNSVHIETGEVVFDTVSALPIDIDTTNYTVFSNINTSITKQGDLMSLDDTAVDGYGSLTLSMENFKFYKEISDPYYKSAYAPYTKSEIVLTVPIPLLSGQTVTGVPVADTGYIWDDTDTWDDAQYWTETTLTDNIQLKVTMLPSYDIQLEKVVSP